MPPYSIGSKMPPGKIGVVITARNYGRFLRQCVGSVLAQPAELLGAVIIVDDGSTDETPQISSEFVAHPLVSYLRLDGIGLARAGNAGIARLDTEWVLRLDADDWLPAGALAALLEGAAGGPDFISGDLQLVDVHGAELGVLSQAPAIIGSGMIRAPAGSGCLYRRQLWERLGGYDESLKFQEDFDFWLRVVEQGKTAHADRVVYAYRQHPGTMSTNFRARAEARRLVKRRALARRGLGRPRRVAVCIATELPRTCRAATSAALERLGDSSLLDRLLSRLGEEGLGTDVMVEAADEKVAAWAHSRGLALAPDCYRGLLAGRGDAAAGLAAGALSAIVAVSPYFPFLYPGRIAETLETAALGGHGRIDTVEVDPFPRLILGEGGWREADACAGNELPGPLGLSGGVSAFLAAGSGRSGVQVYFPEGMLVADATSLVAARAVLSAAPELVL